MGASHTAAGAACFSRLITNVHRTFFESILIPILNALPHNATITTQDDPSTSWRNTSITIMYKHGDPTLPSSYRSVYSITILTLLSQLFFRRLQPTLDEHRTPDQPGFTPEHATTDHLHTSSPTLTSSTRMATKFLGSLRRLQEDCRHRRTHLPVSPAHNVHHAEMTTHVQKNCLYGCRKQRLHDLGKRHQTGSAPLAHCYCNTSWHLS